MSTVLPFLTALVGWEGGPCHYFDGFFGAPLRDYKEDWDGADWGGISSHQGSLRERGPVLVTRLWITWPWGLLFKVTYLFSVVQGCLPQLTCSKDSF